jgi:hypothetical protein
MSHGFFEWEKPHFVIGTIRLWCIRRSHEYMLYEICSHVLFSCSQYAPTFPWDTDTHFTTWHNHIIIHQRYELDETDPCLCPLCWAVQPMQIVSIIWVAYPATLWQPLWPNQEHKLALENFLSLSLNVSTFRWSSSIPLCKVQGAFDCLIYGFCIKCLVLDFERNFLASTKLGERIQ